MNRARLVIGDDDAAARYIIQNLLSREYEIVAVAPDGRAALDAVERHAPDLVLLDIRMPALSGIAVARTLKKTTPGTKVVFVSSHSDEDYIEQAFRMGADGYVLKSRIISDLKPAIEKALAGSDRSVASLR